MCVLDFYLCAFVSTLCCQVLHLNPRYILFMHLVVNDILLLSQVCLLLLNDILFNLNAATCICLILIAICTNTNTPLNLAAMALECYIAVCFPLRHAQICSVKKTYLVICLIWVMSWLAILPDLFVTLGTESLGFFLSRVFCYRDRVFRKPFLKQKRDASFAIFLVLVWFILFYTYFKILFAAKAASADAKKARNTVVLHGFQLLLSMLMYVWHLFVERLTILFPEGAVSIRFTLFILIQILPRLISPVIYGLRDRTFRRLLLKVLPWKGL